MAIFVSYDQAKGVFYLYINITSVRSSLRSFTDQAGLKDHTFNCTAFKNIFPGNPSTWSVW